MHSASVILTTLAASSSSTKQTNGNALVSVLPLIVIFGLAYVFFFRPRAQAARRQRDTLTELSAGDEVLTGAGIFGTVLDVQPDRVTIETAPGTRITVLRSTIARRLTEPEPAQTPSWDERDEDSAHDAYHEYELEHDEDEEAHGEHDEHDEDGHVHDEHDEQVGTEHDQHEDDEGPGDGRKAS